MVLTVELHGSRNEKKTGKIINQTSSSGRCKTIHSSGPTYFLLLFTSLPITHFQFHNCLLVFIDLEIGKKIESKIMGNICKGKQTYYYETGNQLDGCVIEINQHDVYLSYLTISARFQPRFDGTQEVKLLNSLFSSLFFTNFSSQTSKLFLSVPPSIICNDKPPSSMSRSN